MVKRQIELDFIRGVAILLVLDFHFRETSPINMFLRWIRFEHFGWAGVDLFFVLSGFLVGGLLLKEWKRDGHINGFRFLKRRAFKIWPAYYCFLLFEVVSRLTPYKTFLTGNLLNIQNYTGTRLFQTWSLAVEEHFYLLLTFVLVLCSRRGTRIKSLARVLVVTGIVVTILRTGLLYWSAKSGKDHGLVTAYHGVSYYTHTRIDGLLWGVLLAILFHYYPTRFDWLRKQRAVLVTALVASLVGLYFVAFPFIKASSVAIADVGCLAVFLLLYRPANRHSLPYRLIAWMGVYSYGIYLWHLVAFEVIVRVVIRVNRHIPSHPIPSIVVNGLLIATSILLGVVTTKMIEFPFLRLRERMVPVPSEPQPAYETVGAES